MAKTLSCTESWDIEACCTKEPSGRATLEYLEYQLQLLLDANKYY